MVTSYTYEPLVGITSMTDPRGYKTTYKYDEFNRLQYVKDAEGNILSENEYKYRTQN
jgi:YD repeat-containing protein